MSIMYAAFLSLIMKCIVTKKTLIAFFLVKELNAFFLVNS